MSDARPVLIVGSGFAGTILARCLQAAGVRVLVVEKSRHPRFALGESSTPLGNLALERLAVRFGLEDLYHQAAWGRWTRHLARRGGLKRGFTFFEAGPSGEGRSLYVAASPDARTADSQWLRSSVDEALVQRARAEGVQVLERSVVEVLEWRGDHWCASLRGPEGARAAEARFVVDATGGGQFARAHWGVASASGALSTDLHYGHFRGLVEPTTSPGAPYDAPWSAVHHLLDGGWMYELRFADGLVSAGVVQERPEAADPAPGSAEERFHAALRAAPELAARFAAAEAVRPIAARRGVAYRSTRAFGEGWAALPHGYAFVDPLFATGIAWSLLGVERLADLLLCGESAAADGAEYQRLLEAEADLVGRLVRLAYRHLSDFDTFCVIARAYFVVASLQETRQRLLAPASPSWAWTGFLGADDPVVGRLLEALERAGDVASAEAALQEACRTHDVAGFAQPRQHYAVDLDPLRAGAAKLGLEPDELERRLPRLFSPDRFEEALAEADGPPP